MNREALYVIVQQGSKRARSKRDMNKFILNALVDALEKEKEEEEQKASVVS
jgi:hypothetical protein